MIEQLADFCKEKFRCELESALTLANVACWIFFIIAWHVYHTLDDPFLLSGLSNVKVGELVDVSSGVLSSFSVIEFIASFVFVYFVSWLSKELLEGLFYLYSLRDDFGSHMVEANKMLLLIKKRSPMAMYFLGKEAEKNLSSNRTVYSKKRMTCQILLGFGVSALLGFDFSISNLLLFFIFFTLFVIFAWRSFNYYVESILPYFIAQKYSAGGFASFEEGASEDGK